jgi:hypothetical protein
MKGVYMKQIISFKKDIPFNTKIGEITSISLEHSLKMIEQDHIAGEFVVSGDYKITDVSVNKEPFSYSLPFEIALDTKYNTDNVKVDIDDFYYEITNDQVMNVNIDIFIDGIEVINEPDKNIEEKEGIEMNDRTFNIEEINNDEEISNIDEPLTNDSVLNSDLIDDDRSMEDKKIMNLFKEIETPPVDITVEDNNVTNEKIKSLFDTFDDKNETFTTYHVHIVRENDTIDSIITKYRTTKEELSLYNKIDELKLGDKIIIPAIINE